MDPFLEGQAWKSFHTRFINGLGDELVARLRPRYIVDIEDFVYLTTDDEPTGEYREPDLAISAGDLLADVDDPHRVTAAGVALAPAVLTLPMPRRGRQHHLVVRRRDNREVLTAIELLSPWNKAGEGRTQYLGKRAGLIASYANLVEFDLLRGGQRLPTKEKLPAGDYYAFVCRQSRIPKVEVFHWTLRDRLPSVPIPLAPGDSDCRVDLQEVFAATYDRAGYDYSLDRSEQVAPPLNAADAEWVRAMLVSAERRGTPQ